MPRIESVADGRNKIYRKVVKAAGSVITLIEETARNNAQGVAEYTRVYADIDDAVQGDGLPDANSVEMNAVVNYQGWREYIKPQELAEDDVYGPEFDMGVRPEYISSDRVENIITAAKTRDNDEVHWGFCPVFDDLNESSAFRLFDSCPLLDDSESEKTIGIETPYQIRALVQHNVLAPNGITRVNFRRHGQLGIQIFELKGRGLLWTDNIIKAFLNEFEGSISDGIWYTNPRLTEIGVQGRYAQTDLIFDFQYSTTKTGSKV